MEVPEADPVRRPVDGLHAEWIDGKIHLEIEPSSELFAMLLELAAEGDAIAQVREIQNTVARNGFRFDPINRIASYLGHEVFLSRTEARVIETLWRAEGAIVPYSKLLSNAWGYMNGLKGGDLVRSHLRNIRRKFADAGIPETVVQSVRGYGARIYIPRDAA